MLHAEYVTGNPVTGRQVWIVRHIGGKYGDKYDWCCNVIRPYHLSRTAVVEAMVGKGLTRQQHRELFEFITGRMGFRSVLAQRNGRWRRYMSYEGKDGAERNVLKLKDEWRKVKAALKANKGSHDPYVNAWVESHRASPYFTGHVDAFYYPLSIILIVVGFVL